MGKDSCTPTHKSLASRWPLKNSGTRFRAGELKESHMAPRKKDASKAQRKVGGDRFEPIRSIRVRGAKENNLKQIDVDIPRDVLTVITGLSGSGKSSLAFDTIFAEGQRKYMESLSAYARQFLDQLRKPDVESIEGLTPTIAIEQRSSSRNPRSTVATTTEIYDYLRLLFARVATPTCWSLEDDSDGESSRCGLPIDRSDPQQIYDAVQRLEVGTKLMVLAPVVRSKKGYHRDILEDLSKEGFVRARVNGEMVDLGEVLTNPSENPLELGRYEMHNIEAVVDRLVVKEGARKRLVDSVETALRLGEGVVMITIQTEKAWDDLIYSEHYACAEHPECSLDELEPRLFSFNSPFGACPDCQGLGQLLQFTEELCLPDPSKGVGKGGIAPWKRSGPAGIFAGRLIRRFCRRVGVSVTTPIANLDPEIRRMLMHGTTPEDEAQRGFDWVGVIPHLTAWFEKTESAWAKDFLPQFMVAQTCHSCKGARLNIRALSVMLTTEAKIPESLLARRAELGLTLDRHKINLSDFTQLRIAEAQEIIAGLKLSGDQERIAGPIVREVGARLGFLSSVGLEYLSLDRKTGTLSGGEAQRIRLASQVGSGIVGATYVLDEPTIGLHARDNARLIKTLRHLADIGNTVIVVEHDEEMIRCADHILDVGPGPGVHGGTIVAQGQFEEICANKNSLTGKYLSGVLEIPTPEKRRKLSKKNAIQITGANQNNLRDIKAHFPLGGLICVTGVSGSGKSTLVNETLLKAVTRHLGKKPPIKSGYKEIKGLEAIGRVVDVNQSPIGRTPRSNPATYTNIFDEIRKLFTEAPEARTRGYKAGRFSFNVKGGRCEPCGGQGVRKISMHFLPDVFVVCEVCEGKRYNPDTLAVRFKDRTISEVLDMTIEEACSFFSFHPKIKRMTQCLYDVGLGYLTLGQQSPTLSGGEAQRVKLATELGTTLGSLGRRKKGPQHTLYVLDEPTTGLHFEDIAKLLGVLQSLVDQGHTVVVIEHNLEVIKSSDWILDLGPEGGSGGGDIVAQGPPEKVATVKGSYTGNFLKEILG